MALSQSMLGVDNDVDYVLHVLGCSQNDHITDGSAFSTGDHNLLLGCKINLVNVISMSFV